MNEDSLKAALQVMQAHIDALNAHDEAALVKTLHFPHIRLSGTSLKVWDTPETYFTDFRARAGGNWARSRFDNIRVVQTSETKVHLETEVNRYDANDQLITSFPSLWVITFEDDRWAAKMRSSFASK